MPFVKLDCGMLLSTIWVDIEARDVFITALLMAEPALYPDPVPQIEVNALKETGWAAPPGWYGYVPAAGPGIVRMSGIKEPAGLEALVRLGNPDPGSRSHEFEGRRLIRIDGGYLVLNYIRYREKDATTAERSKRWRERKKTLPTRVTDTPTRVIRHQAEAEAEADLDRSQTLLSASPDSAPPDDPVLGKRKRVTRPCSDGIQYSKHFDYIWSFYPNGAGKGDAWNQWVKALRYFGGNETSLKDAVKTALGWQLNCHQWRRDDGKFIPHLSRYLHGRRWDDKPGEDA